MAKPGSERQMQYEARQKERDKEAYLKKRREQKARQRAALKKDKVRYEALKAKDRERKRQSRNPSDNPPILNSSYTTRQSLGKAVSRVSKTLPQTPVKKKQIISKILSNFSPTSKGEIFASARKSTSSAGRPSSGTIKNKEVVMSFLERPDISYCKPGRRDTIYCGKNENGEKVYKPKHYLLWSLKEVVDMFNNEHDFNITYYNLQKLLKLEKHLLLSSQTPEDDCRCEKCENSELLLTSIKGTLIKSNYHELASKLEVDIIEFISGNVCSVKDFDCCSNVCDKCPGKDLMTEIMDVLSRIDSITYNKWMKKGNYVQKIEILQSGEDVAEEFLALTGSIIKLHIYNIFRQYSELKHLKKNLGPDEVILSVDFSRNYDNKQHHEIQSAYFGHEAFTLFTAACYSKGETTSEAVATIDKDTDLQVLPVVIVSNETRHERNIAFTCNQMLLEFMIGLFPGVKKVHFWSDGCGSQFRSQYTFRFLCNLPAELEITWNYGEAHHFKGPHDGIGGTVKRKVYADVKSQKVVVQDAKHFAEYAKGACSVNVLYLDSANIISPSIEGSKYIPGTLQIHQVKRVNDKEVEFFYNSQYKKSSKLLMKVNYGSTVFSNDLQIEKEVEREAEEVEVEEEVSITKPNVGDIVVVKYAAERKSLQYLGIVQSISGEKLYVQFLKSSGGKTYSLKANDCDEIDVKCVLSVIKNFSVNIRSQYIVHMDYNLDM